MITYFISLHDTETEEIIGHVAPINPMNIDDFDNILRESWKEYDGLHNDVDDDITIEDFVEWHNNNYDTQIDYVIGSFIQL